MKYTGNKSLSSILRIGVEIVFYTMIIFEIYHIVLIFKGGENVPSRFGPHGPFEIAEPSFYQLLLFKGLKLASIFLVYYFKSILKNFSKDLIFIKENFVIMRKVGIIIVLVSGLQAIDRFIFWKRFMINIEIQDSLRGVLGWIRPEILFLGLAIIILAEIFKHAVNIKNENDLTI